MLQVELVNDKTSEKIEKIDLDVEIEQVVLQRADDDQITPLEALREILLEVVDVVQKHQQPFNEEEI